MRDYLNWQPPGQYRVYQRDKDGIICVRKHDGMVVIESTLKYSDGNYWKHVSFSHKSKMPSYETMCMVKRDFFGDESKAIAVFPPKSEHVNIHPYCLHLWSSEALILPDFRIMGGI